MGPMNKISGVLVFTLDEQRYGLELPVVERVFPMVEVTPLPKSPDIVLGIINVRGSLVPVFDIRRRFGCSERECGISDQLILASTKKRRVALPVDTVQGVVEPASKPVDAGEILPDLPYIQGVVKLPDGLVLIHDLDTFLSLDEETALNVALPGGGI
ncbi:MAG: chemotaxis protein CheW [Methanoregula sp.]|nr:MAG: chemotaxis protein CheW [Methanoregula sp.]